MNLALAGRARCVGDNINTDYIISSGRKRDTLDESVLKQWLLEAVDPSFAASVQPGDLLVAGRNFGCGSAMEIAVTVIQAAGMRAVLAQSFARTFYRNAINNGLLALECDTSGIAEGDGLSLHVSHDRIDVSNQRTGRTSPCPALPSFLLAILEAGGLVPYMKAHGHSLRPR